MAKIRVTYLCAECGYAAPSYLGRCPECRSWGSFSEQVEQAAAKSEAAPKTDTVRTRGLMLDAPDAEADGVRRLSDVSMESAARFSTGFPEMDRVLGGGVTPGAYVLVGGDPGIGKSTLMLQMAAAVGSQGKTTLYIAGEESPRQIKMRADRLALKTDPILVLPATRIQRVLAAIRESSPDLVVIDSVQSMYCPDVSGTPGSVNQIRESAAILMEAAKRLNTPIFLIGHVTKEGSVSGPKLLEHTVDAVLYLEGDKYQNLRILRTVKNRFGSTQEIGVFEMAEGGLREVGNPSELFMAQSMPGASGMMPGSVIAVTMEGSRPILVEIQALVGQSAYATPRRVGIGIEANRLHQIVAVLERRLGLDFSRQDVYVNVVGGLRIDEPAADLAVAIAIIGSARNRPVIPGTVITGELGLTGEIRPVRQCANRLREAERIGFQRMLIPRTDGRGAENLFDTAMAEVIPVDILADAVTASFPAMGETRLSREEEAFREFEECLR